MVAHVHPAALLLITQPAVQFVASIGAWRMQGRGSYAAAVASPRVSGEVSVGAMRSGYMMAGVQGQVQHSTPRYFDRQPKAAPQSGVSAQGQGRQPLVPNLRLHQPSSRPQGSSRCSPRCLRAPGRGTPAVALSSGSRCTSSRAQPASGRAPWWCAQRLQGPCRTCRSSRCKPRSSLSQLRRLRPGHSSHPR